MKDELVNIKPKVKRIGAYNPSGLWMLIHKSRPAMWEVFYQEDLIASFAKWEEAVQYAVELKIKRDKEIVKRVKAAYDLINQVGGANG